MDNLPIFTESKHCASRKHCVACRNLHAGRSWREVLAKSYALPGDNVDFVCPHGIPWNAADIAALAVAAPRARTQRPPAQPKPLPDALPRKHWPMLIGGMAWFSKPGECGVGDTVHNQLKLIGSDVVELVFRFAGISCGCEDRRAWLNARFPYPTRIS